MSMPTRPLLTSTVLSTALVAMTGCHTPPENRGQTGARLDPTHDSPSEVGSLDLRSQDLVSATDKMAQDIATRLDIVNRVDRPRIYVSNVENWTSDPTKNYSAFLGRLRSLLLASGTRHGLDMRRESDFVERLREREFGDKQPEKSADAYRSQNEYALTCIVHDQPSGYTNYFLLEYQLVQIVDDAETGPDVGGGAIVWSNFYEVKYQ